ncbi:hypothetical protein XENOCAPTIV_000629 [Xenoophorus captivus]|uniref:Uncharacterized protein n=1 Tax=Xenoophorus captivus TaxID=1517983 RepID=A0ABV0R7T1_9TELE
MTEILITEKNQLFEWKIQPKFDISDSGECERPQEEMIWREEITQRQRGLGAILRSGRVTLSFNVHGQLKTGNIFIKQNNSFKWIFSHSNPHPNVCWDMLKLLHNKEQL